VAVDLSGKKVGDQIGNADRRGIPKALVVGDEEVKTGSLKIKNLSTGGVMEATEETLASCVK
jgi:histidyl-tRNA synthetase